MNWLDFSASVIASITSLAWPAALVLSVWIFRSEIKPLIPRMRLKHNDTEISFALDEVRKLTETLPPSPEPLSAPDATEQSRFDKIALLSPRAAILDARTEFDKVIRDLAKEEGLPERAALYQALTSLSETGILSPTAASIADDLRVIGNTVAHDHSDAEMLTPTHARVYRDLVDRLVATIEADKAKRNAAS